MNENVIKTECKDCKKVFNAKHHRTCPYCKAYKNINPLK